MPGVKHLKDHQKQAPGEKFPEGDDGSVQEELPVNTPVLRCRGAEPPGGVMAGL